MTDRETDRQKAMHKSLPCISTGGLKNNVVKKNIATLRTSIQIWRSMHRVAADRKQTRLDQMWKVPEDNCRALTGTD